MRASPRFAPGRRSTVSYPGGIAVDREQGRFLTVHFCSAVRVIFVRATTSCTCLISSSTTVRATSNRKRSRRVTRRWWSTSEWGRLGLSICYDLRFGALYRALAQAGAEFITIPAAFTQTTGKAHWHTLVRARAIETGCFRARAQPVRAPLRQALFLRTFADCRSLG